MEAKGVNVDKFFDRLNIPVYQCARFYGYYYLYAIKNMDDKRKIVDNTASMQKEAFKNYGKYAVASELNNIGSNVSFKTDKIYKIIRNNTTESVVRRMGESWYDEIYAYEKDSSLEEISVVNFYETISPKIPDEVAHEIVYENIDNASMEYILDKYDTSNWSKKDIKRFMWRMLREFTFTEAPPFNPSKPQVKSFLSNFTLDISLFDTAVFSSDKFFSAAKTIFQGLNWSPNYGGDAWYRISSVLNNIDEYSDITAVDMLWGLQHNNNLWMDKIRLDGKDDYLVRAGKELKEYLGDDYVMGEHIDLAPPNPENPKNYVTEDVLQRFLDVRRSGEFYKVWPYITEVNPNAKVGLDNYEEIFKQAGR